MGAFSYVYRGPVSVSLCVPAIGGYSGPYWTPVDEEIPEEGKTVLVYYRDGGMAILSYDGVCDCGRRYTWSDNGESFTSLEGWDPTHWMPLPDPPNT